MSWKFGVPFMLTGSLATVMLDRFMWTPEWTGFPGPTPIVLVVAILVTTAIAS
jgi:hypothetical protein